MLRHFCRWILPATSILVIAATTDAQQAVRSVSIAAQSSVASAARRVTLDLRKIPLDSAVQMIARAAGTSVSYDRALVSSVAQRVTAQFKGAPVQDALARILYGTGLAIKTSSGGELVIAKADERYSSRMQGVVVGKVTDIKTGRGIAGAKISVGTNGSGTTSTEDGSYRLTNVGAGTQVISARLVGYTKQTRTLTIAEGATVTADFRLEPSANVLDQVVVTGTIVQTELKSVPNAITVITAKQIEERGITRIDQLFRGDVPGLFSLNMGSKSQLDEVVMFSRGATALTSGSNGSDGINNTAGALTNTIKTYIDGVEMADSRYLSQIDPTSIERIEIIAGPQASTIYGAGAINGVMQIFTKRGKANKPQLTFNYSFGTVENSSNNSLAPSHLTNFTASGMEGRISYNIGTSWNYVGSWTPGKQTQLFSVNGGGRTEWSKFTADASARHGLTKNRQRGNATQGETELRVSGIWIITSFVGLQVPQNSSLDGQSFSLNMGYRPYSWWSHGLTVGGDASTTESFKTAPGWSSRTDSLLTIGPNAVTSSRSQSYNTTLQIPFASLARLDLVVGGSHQRVTSSSWQASGLVLSGTLTNPFVTRNKPAKNTGGFIQGKLGFKDALFFDYGVRAEWNPNIGDKAKVLPGRYGVVYTRDIGMVSTKLRGAYGRSIRPPNNVQKLPVAEKDATLISMFGPHDIGLPNPYLLPEHQQGGEAGVEFYVGNRGSLVITRYNQTVNDLISQASGIDSILMVRAFASGDNQFACSSYNTDNFCFRRQRQFINAGSIRNQGWELQGSLSFGPLTTNGTYSWTKSRVVGITPAYKFFFTGTEFQPGRPFDYLPEHTWALGFSYAHASSTVSLNMNGISQRYMTSTYFDMVARNTHLNRDATTATIMSVPNNIRSIGPGYSTADLNAAHRFTRMMDATLQINNLTNYYKNDYAANYTSAGRSTRVGVRLRMN